MKEKCDEHQSLIIQVNRNSNAIENLKEDSLETKELIKELRNSYKSLNTIHTKLDSMEVRMDSEFKKFQEHLNNNIEFQQKIIVKFSKILESQDERNNTNKIIKESAIKLGMILIAFLIYLFIGWGGAF